MPASKEFLEHVLETMRLFQPVETRRMFGGWGFYKDGAFFALIMDDVLYLKSDAENRAEYAAAGLTPFSFEKEGETVVTGYYAAPEEVFESAEVMARWARIAYGAALRKAKAKRAPRKR
jgi:DNA transformation protein and related proteins